MLPVCYGDALYGMWKGFEELKALGWIDRVPRFVAAEVSGSLATAMEGGDALPPAWLDQLAVGGRIVAPVHDGAGRQVLVVVDRTERGHERSIHEVVQFVPLRSGLVR